MFRPNRPPTSFLRPAVPLVEPHGPADFMPPVDSPVTEVDLFQLREMSAAGVLTMRHEYLGTDDQRVFQLHCVEMLLDSLGRGPIPLDPTLAEQLPGTQRDVDQRRRLVDGFGYHQRLVHPTPGIRAFRHENTVAQGLDHDLVFTPQLESVAHRRLGEGSRADQALALTVQGHEGGGWHGGAPLVFLGIKA